MIEWILVFIVIILIVYAHIQWIKIDQLEGLLIAQMNMISTARDLATDKSMQLEILTQSLIDVVDYIKPENQQDFIKCYNRLVESKTELHALVANFSKKVDDDNANRPLA